MKKLFISLLLISSINLYAQEITVSEGTENIGNGSNNALSSLVYETDAKDVMKAWKSYVKEFKGKTSSPKGTVFSDDAVISSISTNTIDIYAKAISQSDAVKLIVAFDLGGVFLSSSQNADGLKKAKEIVYNFSVKTTKESIEEQLKEAEKEHGKLEKNLKKLKNDKDNLHSSIEKYKELIIQAERNIENNIKDQATTTTEIGKQAKVVEKIKATLQSVK